MAYFTLVDNVPLCGLEGVYRCESDGIDEPVGYLRRADFGYFVNKSIGKSYIRRPDGKPVDTEYLRQGSYKIDVLGKLYPAKLHIGTPFDPTHLRTLGHYNEIIENMI